MVIFVSEKLFAKFVPAEKIRRFVCANLRFRRNFDNMLDTLTISKKLKAAGFTEKQAETVAEMEVERQHHLATKEDLSNLEARIDQRFEQVDQRFEQVDQRFEQVDQRFEQVDQRFDQMYKQMDQRFDQVDKRFDQTTRMLMWAFRDRSGYTHRFSEVPVVDHSRLRRRLPGRRPSQPFRFGPLQEQNLKKPASFDQCV